LKWLPLIIQVIALVTALMLAVKICAMFAPYVRPASWVFCLNLVDFATLRIDLLEGAPLRVWFGRWVWIWKEVSTYDVAIPVFYSGTFSDCLGTIPIDVGDTEASERFSISLVDV
jgi:hypothetical protein